MPSVFPPTLLRLAVSVVVISAVFAPLWNDEVASSPRMLTSLWQKRVAAQVTGLDLTWDGRTVALTVAPLPSNRDNRLSVYDVTGREMWAISRGLKILNVSLAGDGQHLAIGLMDFAIALFSKHGELLWEQQSVGLPHLVPPGETLVAFNSGINGFSNILLEVFLRNGEKTWSWRRPGHVWRAVVSDQGDLLLSLWNGEVLLLDRHHRILWQQTFSKDIMALAISPEDAQYFAVGTGVLDPELHLFERTGRLVWRRKLPLGVTELSLAKQGEFLLSYGNTIRGQHLALFRRSGELQWTYHLQEPAMESSKAVIVPQYPLVVAGIERDQQSYLQGFDLTGSLQWMASLPEPIFDFRVSRDGRYVATSSDTSLYFFDTRPAPGVKAELQQ